MQVGDDQKQSREDKRRDHGEEPRVPEAIGIETDDRGGPETEAERQHQADGGERRRRSGW